MGIFRTIRMRFTLIYFILVLSLLTLIGVFILRSFEDYSTKNIRRTMDDVNYVVSSELMKIENPLNTPDLIRHLVNQQFEFGSGAEVFVINAKTLEIIATTLLYGEFKDLNAGLLARALEGETSEADTMTDEFSVKDRVYTTKDGKILIYVRYNLGEHLEMLENVRIIIANAIMIALLTTSFISIFLSKSITDPIKKLTKQVKLLADGDFNQVVDVSTDDEIGAFSTTFNYLVSVINERVEQLTEEKEKIEIITKNIDEGLVALTMTGGIIHSNKKAYELLGEFNADEVLALHSAGETIIQRKGRYLQLSFDEFTERSERGLIVAVQDITKQQQIDDMRKAFIADVSHELKTPLTSVISYAETIRDSEDLDDVSRRKFLGVIVSEAERMTRIVKDLLYLSSIDSAQQYLRYSEVNIRKSVEKCVENLRLQAVQNGQKIDMRRLDEVVAVVDQDQFEQLIINILSNAIKYSGDGSVTAVELADMGDEFSVVVADSGRGISEADLEHIFDRFYRVDKARSRAMGGTGLGLSIAKGIVELHGGSIKAESKLGVGTTMTIVIPKRGDVTHK